MTDNLVSDGSAGSSLLRIFAWLIFGTLFIASAIGGEVAAWIYQVDINQVVLDPSSHPEARGSILLSQGIGAGLGLIVLPICYITFFEKKQVARFFRNDSGWPMVIGIIAVAVLGMGLGISPIIEWNASMKFPESLSILEKFEEMAAAVTKSITSDLTPLSFIATFIVVAIIPAVGEELVFRGILQTELQRAFRNPHAAIVITSVLFSAIHFQFLGFVPRMLIGAFLGYLYYWSGNLWIPMLGHFFNNGLQLLGLYLYQLDVISFDMESTDAAPIPWVIVGVFVTTVTLWYLRNYFRSTPSPVNDAV